MGVAGGSAGEGADGVGSGELGEVSEEGGADKAGSAGDENGSGHCGWRVSGWVEEGGVGVGRLVER